MNHKFSTFKTGLCLLTIMFLVNINYAKDTTQIDVPAKKFRELQISSSVGFSVWGPKYDIENNMISSGFGDDTGPNWLGGDGVYPIVTKWPVIDLEATLYFRMNHGISFNAAIADYLHISGNDDIGIGNHLSFNSKLSSYSFSYTYRTNNNKLNFFIGPSFMVHHIKSDNYAQNSFKTTNQNIGLYLGFAVHLIEKPHWFLAFKSNLRLSNKSEIGPYTVEHQTGIATDNPETHTSVYNQTEVNLNTINIGVVVGLRFNNQLN